MDRMTVRAGDGTALLAPKHEEKYTMPELIDILLNCLADYEDTGMTPAEIESEGIALIVAKDNLGKFMEELNETESKLDAYEVLEEKGHLVHLPCKIGDTVYRICPKCNDRHDGSCENCAWQGTGGAYGCDVFGMWQDGQYPAERCTIVPWMATWSRLPTIMRQLGRRVFLFRDDAERFLEEAKK